MSPTPKTKKGIRLQQTMRRRRSWNIGITERRQSNPNILSGDETNGTTAYGRRRRQRGTSVGVTSTRGVGATTTSTDESTPPRPSRRESDNGDQSDNHCPQPRGRHGRMIRESSSATTQTGSSFSRTESSDAETGPPSEPSLPDLDEETKARDGLEMDVLQEKQNLREQQKELEEQEQAAAMQAEVALLERLQQMLQREDLTTIEQINVLYALGRQSAKMRRFEQALEYHQAELELTQELVDDDKTTEQGMVGRVVAVVKPTNQGGGGTSVNDDDDDKDDANNNDDDADDHVVVCENDAVARVLDGMARIAKQGLGNAEAALSYHQASLEIRQALQEHILEEARHCSRCQGRDGAPPAGQFRLPPSNHHQASAHSSSSSYSLCRWHHRAVLDTVRAMEETRQHMGRILFEQGQVNQAVTFITALAPPSSPAALPPGSGMTSVISSLTWS